MVDLHRRTIGHMRVDTHQHFWIQNQRDYTWMSDKMDPLRRNYLPADLLPCRDGTKNNPVPRPWPSLPASTSADNKHGCRPRESEQAIEALTASALTEDFRI
jgi:hypothetical protein